MVFSKKLRWNMIFMVLLGKMIFLFPENMILLLGKKMKDDLSQKKIHKNMIFYSNVLKRWSFQRDRAGTWSFLCYLERGYFFSRKYYVFSLDRKWKITFHKKYAEVRNFLYIRTSVTNLTSCPTAKKIKDDLIPQKYT